MTSPSHTRTVRRPLAPRVLVVTDAAQVPADRTLTEVVEAALDAGADGVLVRERHLPTARRRLLVEALAERCDAAGARLLVAAPVPLGLGIPRATIGVHLRSADTHRVRELDEELSTAGLVGRSCHGVADVVRAADDGLDLVTLSPVAPSGSKPGYGPRLGVHGLRAALTTARRVRRSLPAVLALGGIEAAHAAQCIRAGADGVAVMGAVMRADDPGHVTRCVVDAVNAAAAAS